MMQNLNKPWPCGLKNGMRNWVNFHYSTQKSEKLYIDGLFLSKAYNISAKKNWGGLCVMTLKGDAKFKGKLTCGFKNDIRNLINFHVSSWKSENLHLDWIILSKGYKDLDEKIQKSYVSWHWRVMQSLKKKTWGIWWIFTQPLKGPKTLLQWAIFAQSIWGMS